MGYRHNLAERQIKVVVAEPEPVHRFDLYWCERHRRLA